MKQLRVAGGIFNFKVLKYETRTLAEKKEIEELVMEKMGIWKYSPAQMQPQIHANIFTKITFRWENKVQTVKNIFEQ